MTYYIHFCRHDRIMPTKGYNTPNVDVPSCRISVGEIKFAKFEDPKITFRNVLSPLMWLTPKARRLTGLMQI